MKLTFFGALLAGAASLATRGAAASVAVAAPASRDTTASCLDRADDTRWPAQSIFVNATLADTLHRDYLPAAATIANTVATLAADTYGGADSLSPGEAMLTWRATWRGVLVTAFRDGRLTRVRDTATRGDSSPRAAELDGGPAPIGQALIGQSLQAMLDAHAVPAWPASLADDSVRFELELGPARVGPYPRSFALRAIRSARSPFTLRIPPTRPVALRKSGHAPQYPSSNQAARYSGTLSVEFVVDRSGRADTSTFKPLGEDEVRRMNAEQQRAYRDFLESVRRSILESRYEPATIGGCTTRMVVQQQFVFRM